MADETPKDAPHQQVGSELPQQQADKEAPRPQIPSALANFIEVERRMAQSLRPFADIQKHLNGALGQSFPNIAKQLSGITPELLKQAQSFARPTKQILDAIAASPNIHRQLKDVLGAHAEQQRQIRGMLTPLASQIQALTAVPRLPQIEAAIRNAVEAGRPATLALQNLTRNLPRALQSFHGVVPTVSGIIKNLAELEQQTRLLDSAGFLPHVTMPRQLLSEHAGDGNALSEALEKHYRENWTTVEPELLTRIERYQIDDEAKTVFREALALHRAGHYRSVVRVLFPEIERVASSDEQLAKIAKSKKLTSTKLLQELAGELGMSEIEPRGYFGLALFKRLKNHLYANIGDSKAKLARMVLDPVPNRHAAIHGLVVYGSFKNSLNTLFMTDYIFQVVDVVKRNVAEAEATREDEDEETTEATHKQRAH